MTDCINTKIEKALQNKDVVKIMNKASNGFRKQLDEDIIYTCQINALWKSFLNFKPEKNTKFTTYLYNGVFIECIKEVKFKNKSRFATGKMHDNISSKDTSSMMVDILDELSTEEEKSLVLDKMSNMTIDEMATKRNSNRETTRKKLNKALRKIRKKFSSCV
jgi:DNA-directed RNA polymerase specialized sigma24 family protein